MPQLGTHPFSIRYNYLGYLITTSRIMGARSLKYETASYVRARNVRAQKQLKPYTGAVLYTRFASLITPKFVLSAS